MKVDLNGEIVKECRATPLLSIRFEMNPILFDMVLEPIKPKQVFSSLKKNWIQSRMVNLKESTVLKGMSKISH